MNTNSEELAFLPTIIAEPDDDLPRLVFADWLEEHGQLERSEFIRVQCAVAKPYQCPGTKYGSTCHWCAQSCFVEDHHVGPGYKECGVRCNLRYRERELLTPDNARQWIITPPDYKTLVYVRSGNVAVECYYYDHPGVANWRSVQWFHRGFVDEVSLDWNNWLEADRVLLALTPIRHVRLATWPLGVSGIGYWRTGGTIKLLGVRFTKTYTLPDNWTVGGVTLELLKLEWPMVRKWTLPDEATSTMIGGTGSLEISNYSRPGYWDWPALTGGTAGRASPPRS